MHGGPWDQLLLRTSPITLLEIIMRQTGHIWVILILSRIISPVICRQTSSNPQTLRLKKAHGLGGDHLLALNTFRV